ncbi:hypothetical protein FQA39_LY09223 [Lamprigera yunnana]|nr:hypothetical protein FQA39_LY09223 [Lamprigera yunnana]
MEQGFIKANSSNLPRIYLLMLGEFLASNKDFCSSEFRNVKTSLSSRPSYGEDAISYVQLKREGKICTAKCKICTEHKVHAKLYGVTLTVDEDEEKVTSVQCHDCIAAQGGCKHAIALLMWIHRRSEEPSCTKVQCYWLKSKLSRVGTTLKFITAKDLSNGICILPSNPSVLETFLEEGKKRKLSNCISLVISYSFIQLLQVDIMSRGSYCISKSCFMNKLDNPDVAFFNLPKDPLLMNFTSEQFKKTYPRKILKPSISTNVSPVNVTNEQCYCKPIQKNNIENCQEEISKSDVAINSSNDKLVMKIGHTTEDRDQMVKMQDSVTEKNYVELMNSMTYCSGPEIINELSTNYVSRTPVKKRRITKQYTHKTKKKIAQLKVEKNNLKCKLFRQKNF